MGSCGLHRPVPWGCNPFMIAGVDEANTYLSAPILKLVAGLFFAFLISVSWGQEEMSPLIEAWNDTTRAAEDRLQTAKDLHIEFHQQYPDTVLFYLKEMRELADRADDPLALYSAHNRIGSLLEQQGHLEEALSAFDEAEQVAIALGDSARLGSLRGGRGRDPRPVHRLAPGPGRRQGPAAGGRGSIRRAF